MLMATNVQPRVLGLSEIAQMTRRSVSTLRKMMRAGQLPRPLYGGGHGATLGWLAEDVDAWISNGMKPVDDSGSTPTAG